MGDIKRKRKLYRRPKKAFDSARIEEENVIMDKYGLKNKREIWKAESCVSKLRKRAKSLISKSQDEKDKFFEKLNNMGFVINDISDVLSLTKENWLDRRLQTFVFKKNLANTPSQARQLIVHKHISVNGNIVNIPSFMVTKDLENKLALKNINVKQKPKKEEKVEEENTEEAEEENSEEQTE
ncbi:MAG: 30S ribosomal protein S4 [Nanoarchaeota archaeon]|nr:30S ribosomal protein S4 [Nanoarchaeota archaeon]